MEGTTAGEPDRCNSLFQRLPSLLTVLDFPVSADQGISAQPAENALKTEPGEPPNGPKNVYSLLFSLL